MKQIYLISPSLQASTQAQITDNSYSLGLAYLHAVIEQAGYRILTKNFNSTDENVSFQTIQEDMTRLRPDFLLVQMFTMNRVAAYRIINMAKSEFPGARIIVGGVHASILSRQLLENFPIDYVVIGEGERTIVELLDALAHGKDTSYIRGIAYRSGGKVITTPERELIDDLDDLPFPRHEIFITPDRTMACILTSRGCPFKCSFYCLHTISKRVFRKRSPGNVVSEIEHIVNTFPNIKIIQLADDTFTLDVKRTMDICEEIIRRKIKVKFWCSARFKPATREMFERMEAAGFDSIGFGLETGSRKLMKTIHKSITPEDVENTFEMMRPGKIRVATFLMVGFPDESEETVSETIRFVKKLRGIKPYDLVGVAPLWVYPNTEVFQTMKDKGCIDDAYWLTTGDVPYYTVEHPFRQLYWWSIKINNYGKPFTILIYYYGHFIKKFTLKAIRSLTRLHKRSSSEKYYPPFSL